MQTAMAPTTWLAQFPLLADERIFAVLGNASDTKPLAAWQAMTAGRCASDLRRHGLCPLG